MSTSKSPLPDYEIPPVIEVVCGIQFEPIKGFDAASFGLLWQRFKKEYPTREQEPPLAQVLERFGRVQTEDPKFGFSKTPILPRLFFIHQEPCWLLQIQTDRLLHNWRKATEEDEYPRFDEVHSRFSAAWNRLIEFCKVEDLSLPEVNQLEVTYINHIVQGQGWDDMGSIGQVFPSINWDHQGSFLPNPESIIHKLSFAMPNQTGRLHVSVRHATRLKDDKPVLLCDLTARGIPSEVNEQSIRDWLFLGREWIVRAFSELTSDNIQQNIWRRKT